MTIDVFFKWRPAAILDFGGSEIWRYFCFWYVGFSLWAEFLCITAIATGLWPLKWICYGSVSIIRSFDCPFVGGKNIPILVLTWILNSKRFTTVRTIRPSDYLDYQTFGLWKLRTIEHPPLLFIMSSINHNRYKCHFSTFW